MSSGMCDSYDNMTGICLSRASAEKVTADRLADLTSINDILTEDLFEKVIKQCSTVQRAQMATVCKLWKTWIQRRWTHVTLQDPKLAKQLTWLKRIDKDNLEELKIHGSRYPAGGVPIMQSMVLPCIVRFAGLRRIELDPKGRLLVSPSFLGHLSVLQTLDSLKASCNIPVSNEAATLIELAALTNLKELDLSFPQQDTQINLADELSVLSQLTKLRIKRARSLQQQGGSSAGALCSLLRHLKHLDLWVSRDLHMDLVAPMLTYLHCCCNALRFSCPPACPNLMVLQLDAVPNAEVLMGITTLTRLTLGMSYTLRPSSKVHPWVLRALYYCPTLEFLDLFDCDCGRDDTLKVFGVLTNLKELSLDFTTDSKRYSLSPELSSLQKLETLHLSARPSHQFLGGLEHLPSLSSATVSGSYRGALVQSSSLVRLELRGLEGHGYELEEVLQIGDCPKLVSLTLSDAVDAQETRFMCPESLSNLQELVVHLAYSTVSSPSPTCQPYHGTDVTRLSASLHVLPALRVVDIQAMRRDVVLQQVGHYQHLSLACANISIPPSETAAVARLKSLHLVFETAHPETVDMLSGLGALHKVIYAGDLYVCKELQDIRLGCARANCIMTHAHHGLKTVFEDGYLL